MALLAQQGKIINTNNWPYDTINKIYKIITMLQAIRATKNNIWLNNM